MRRLLRWSFVLGLVLAAALTASYLVARHYLRVGAAEALPVANRALASFGLELSDLEIDQASLRFPATARWRSVAATLRTREDSALTRHAGFELAAREARAQPRGLRLDRIRIVAFGLEGRSIFVTHPATGPEIGGFWYEFDKLGFEARLSFDNPAAGLRRELAELRALLESGLSQSPIEAEGRIGFLYRDAPIVLNVRSERRSEGFALAADREGIQELVNLSGVPLTPAEVELVAQYPLQAPHMLYIYEYAVETSQARAASDPGLPEDAYRHLLWSYLLTTRFGPELAERITDAHEIGSTTNTEADHRMDYHNNGVGRRYALEGRAESEISKLAKRDPQVIRAASEVEAASF